MKGKLRISTMAVVFLTGAGATAFAAGGGGGGAGAGAIGGGAASSPAVPTRPAPGPGLPGINPALINRPCAGGVAGAAPANQNSPLPNSVHRLNEEDQHLLREIQRADDKLAEGGNPKSASPAQSGTKALGSNSASASKQSSTTSQNLNIPQTNGSSPEGPSSPSSRPPRL
jgi:hypothetical protein